MKRKYRKRITIPLLLVALAAGAGTMVAERHATLQQVYTPAEVLQDRLRQPGAWVGRTVLVRGWPVGLGAGTWGILLPPRRSMSCGIPRRRVMFATTSAPRQSLIMVAGKGISIKTPLPTTDDTFLKTVVETAACLPVVGSLVPAAAVEQSVTLRVRVLSLRRCTAPVSPVCPDAVLLQVVS